MLSEIQHEDRKRTGLPTKCGGHANFSYQTGNRAKPRRAIAKVKWHSREIYPRGVSS